MCNNGDKAATLATSLKTKSFLLLVAQNMQSGFKIMMLFWYAFIELLLEDSVQSNSMVTVVQLS